MSSLKLSFSPFIITSPIHIYPHSPFKQVWLAMTRLPSCLHKFMGDKNKQLEKLEKMYSCRAFSTQRPFYLWAIWWPVFLWHLRSTRFPVTSFFSTSLLRVPNYLLYLNLVTNQFTGWINKKTHRNQLL